MKLVKKVDMRKLCKIIMGTFPLQTKLVYVLILCYTYQFGRCNLTVKEIATILKMGNFKIMESMRILQKKNLITEKPYIAKCVTIFYKD